MQTVTRQFCVGHMHIETFEGQDEIYAVTDNGACYSWQYGHLGNTALWVKRNGVWRSYFNKTKLLTDTDAVTETQLNAALENARQQQETCIKKER